MSEKLFLIPPSKSRNYSESGFDSEMSNIQEQMKKLKQRHNMLVKLNDLTDKKRTDEVDFENIEEVVYLEEVEEEEKGENYFIFNAKTNRGEFDVLLEYLGKEEFAERSVYHLHLPHLMNVNTQLPLIKNAILEQVEFEDPIVLTHRFTTFENETSTFVFASLCEHDLVHFNEHNENDYEVILQQGQEYKIAILGKKANVLYRPSDIHQFNLDKLTEYFYIESSKLNLVEN